MPLVLPGRMRNATVSEPVKDSTRRRNTLFEARTFAVMLSVLVKELNAVPAQLSVM